MAEYILRYSRWKGGQDTFFTSTFEAPSEEDAIEEAKETWENLLKRKYTLLTFRGLSMKITWEPPEL